MKVDARQVLSQGGVNSKQGAGVSADDVKNAGMSDVAGENAGDEDLSLPKPNLMRGFTDMSLQPYAEKLASLNMPVTEDNARAMRELMAERPGLSMNEAAFLASNKITGDESLMRVAADVMSGADKTSEMITRVMSTLKISLGEQEFLVNQDLGGGKSVNGNSGLGLTGADNYHINAGGKAPLSELIAAIVKNAPGLITVNEGPVNELNQGNIASSQSPEQIISQPDSNLQTITEKNVENSQKIIENIPANLNGDENTRNSSATAIIAGERSDTAQMPAATGRNEQTQAAGQVPDKMPIPGQAAETSAIAEQTAQNDTKTVRAAVAGLLSNLPQFNGTPQTALDRFSGMLLRIAKDSGAQAESVAAGGKEVEQLIAQLDKMFTKIDRKDTNAGLRLREAREELYTRLALVQEGIDKASPPMREQLLAQTQKMMDHVRFLNNIEQFAYMQLPVQLQEERKTAELYVFKRKGSKRADPDNVNILLSIDLEYMGHWEALLNIKGKDVYLNMEVAGETEKEHFANSTVLLHEMLAEEGFKLINTNIKISKEETTPLTALSVFDRYTGAGPGKIDFKI